MLWVLVLGAILIWAPPPTITHRTGVVRGRHAKAQIKPKPCSVNGVEGTCMFVYECIKTEGKHVGMCVDNFMFGSCCSHNITQNAIIPHHQSNPNVLYSSNNIYSSPRPPNLILSARPQSSSSKHRPSKPVGFVTHPTKKPPTSQQWLREPSTTATTSQKQLAIAKPWTNRPPSFVTSDSNLKPSFPQTKFPSAVGPNSSSVVTQSLLIVPVNSSPASKHPSTVTAPTTTSYISAYDLIATSKPSPPSFTSTTKPPVSYFVSASTTTFTESTPSTWSTSKPSWLGSPTANDILSSSKPSPQHSKPDYWSSEKPTFMTNQVVWTATTEPHFVTRPRPSSNLWSRPKPTRKPISLLGLGLSSTRSNLTTADTNVSAGATTTTTTTTTTTSTTTTTTSSTSTSTTSTTTTTENPDATTNRSAESTTEFSKISNYQYSGQCGVAALSPRPEMRIVGGKNAPFGGWPWQVSVRRTSFFGFSSTHRCGGAVINENWIATAGHCVDDLLTSQIRIRVGEYDFSSVTEPYPFVERAVSKKVVHPKYNFFTYEYDLALVRLESSLEFQPHISPICLPASDDLLIGENATVTGWGRLSEGGTLPSVLQQVSVPIVSNDKCKSMFLRAGRHEFIPEIFLCAGYENGGQDSCQGDSGGPLQVKGKNGRYFLAGIISWGIGCAEANLPGVCTRISKFVPWILENVT